jgi:hypothetical protein
MSTDPEGVLGRLHPRGVGPELRDRVLGAVAQQLALSPGVARLWRWAGAVAAGLLLGVGLNVWVIRTTEARLARLYGPPTVPQPIVAVAEAVESVTDAETARWVQQRLFAAHQERLRSVPFSLSLSAASLTPTIPKAGGT